MVYWDIHEILIQIYFGPVTVDSVEICAILRFGATGLDLPAFLLYLRTAFFEAQLLSSLKIWQLWSPKSYIVFMKLSYAIVTP